MGLGQNIQKIMDKKGINANELATKIGVAPSTIYSMIKRDSRKADIEILLKISDELEVSADELLKDDFEDEQKTEITTIAAHAIQDLSEEEIEEVLNFAKYIKSKNKDSRD